MCCFFGFILIGVKPRLNKAFSDCAPRSGSLRDREICEKCGESTLLITVYGVWVAIDTADELNIEVWNAINTLDVQRFY